MCWLLAIPYRYPVTRSIGEVEGFVRCGLPFGQWGTDLEEALGLCSWLTKQAATNKASSREDRDDLAMSG